MVQENLAVEIAEQPDTPGGATGRSSEEAGCSGVPTEIPFGLGNRDSLNGRLNREGLEGTPREKRFAALVAAGVNKADALVLAGYSASSRKDLQGQRFKTNVEIFREVFKEELRNAGLGPKKYAQKLNEALDATILIRGEERQDTRTQLKALDMALKIEGGYQPQKIQVDQRNLNISAELGDFIDQVEGEDEKGGTVAEGRDILVPKVF